jgi:gluconolactonase
VNAASVVGAGEHVLADGLAFPEGPVVLPGGGVAVVEVRSGDVVAIAPDGRTRVLASPGGGPNGLAWGPGGLLYLCNNGGLGWETHDGVTHPHGQAPDYDIGRIETIDPADGTVRRLYDHCAGIPLCGPNDIVFAPEGSPSAGGFWFTDLGKNRGRERDFGGVYWAASDGSSIVEAGYPLPGGGNGVGLSPDGTILYVAETETGRVWTWPVLGPGELGRQPWPSQHGGRLLIGLGGGRRLDSLAVAASGNVVVGTLVTGEITTISPAGEVVDVRVMPDRMPTNICFGGADLRTAYITLSESGRVLAMPWHEPGFVLPYQPA